MKRIYQSLAILAVSMVAGCSQQAWYEGTKQSQRNECYQGPLAAREECLKALDSETYGEYQRKRQEQPKE